MPFGYGESHQTYHGGKAAHDIETGRRTRTVFDNSMTAHIWAQGVQSFGRSNNGNFYFEGPTLYSYGSHFIVGYLMPDGVALLNADSYSISTSGHQSDARHAVRARYYNVPDLTDLVKSGALSRNTDKAMRAKLIRSHIAKHWQAFAPGEHWPETTGAAAYLAGLVRINATAAIKAGERAAAKAKAREEKSEREAAESDAKRIAAMADSDFLPWLRDADRYTLNQHKARFHKAHKAASARNWTRVKAAVWRRLKAIRGRAAMIDRMESMIESNRYTRRMLATARAYLTNGRLSVIGDTDSVYDLRQIVTALDRVALARRLGGPAHAFAANRAIGAAREELAAYIAERERKEERERFEREAKERAEWLAGDGRRYGRYSDERGGALLRVKGVERDESGAIIGGTLETSHGADVPLMHAINAFRFLKLCRDKATGFTANGRSIRVGHFTIDRVEPSGDFKAGCHVIHWPEVERIALALDVLNLDADNRAVTAKGGRHA